MSIDSAKKTGRPPVDTEAVNVRLHRSVIDEIDAWISAEGPPYVSRPEAIRQLIEIGLIGPKQLHGFLEATKPSDQRTWLTVAANTILPGYDVEPAIRRLVEKGLRT